MAKLDKVLKVPTPVFFIIAIILISYFTPRETKVVYDETEGRPWRYGLVTAPFDFPVYKAEAQLEHERDSIMQEYIPYYNQDKNRAETSIEIFTNDAESTGIPTE